jgi:membrane protease YdiL (CAAX protease family)
MSVPFVLLSAITHAFLLPGLPVAALMAICPALAALVVTWGEDGPSATAELLRRPYDFRRITNRAWYIPILLLYPAISVVSYGAILLMGAPVPPPHIDPMRVLVLAVGFLVAALSEEVGWSGYALDRLQRRYGALLAAFALGAIWALFHVAALRLAGRAWSWIAWWAICTMAARVIMVWIFNNSGKSVSGAGLFHMTLNVCWQTFPVNGSYFDFRITGAITACIACLIVVVSKKRDWLRV